jgi:hypothetical protein
MGEIFMAAEPIPKRQPEVKDNPETTPSFVVGLDGVRVAR